MRIESPSNLTKGINSMETPEDRQLQFCKDSLELGARYAHILFEEHAADEEWL